MKLICSRKWVLKIKIGKNILEQAEQTKRVIESRSLLKSNNLLPGFVD
jgi:hypothetical protein